MSKKLTFEALVESIQQVHEQLSTQAGQAVNISLTLRNWIIGLYIAEYELRGADRANYGEKLLSTLAKRLTTLKISNCNRRQLYDYLNFYRTHPQIVGTVSAQLRPLLPERTPGKTKKVPTPSAQLALPPKKLINNISYRERPCVGRICLGRNGQSSFCIQISA